MEETTELELQEIASELEQIQKMVLNILEMDVFKQEQFILNYFSTVCEAHEEFHAVKEACQRVLERYPNESSINYYETTLVDEAVALLESPYKRMLPETWFQKDLFLYKVGYSLIEDNFKVFEKYALERRFQLIIDNLKRHVYNSFVNNPNFKGENPYYKRHYDAFQRSKKLNKELLSEDFSNYIAFFKGD